MFGESKFILTFFVRNMKAAIIDLGALLSQIENIAVIREECADAQVVVASSEKKKVRITWAKSTDEIYFDFVLEQGECQSDWVDFYDGEAIEEVGAYIIEVVTRFFASATRVRVLGQSLCVSNVEYAVNTEWHPLLNA